MNVTVSDAFFFASCALAGAARQKAAAAVKVEQDKELEIDLVDLMYHLVDKLPQILITGIICAALVLYVIANRNPLRAVNSLISDHSLLPPVLCIISAVLLYFIKFIRYLQISKVFS